MLLFLFKNKRIYNKINKVRKLVINTWGAKGVVENKNLTCNDKRAI